MKEHDTHPDTDGASRRRMPTGRTIVLACLLLWLAGTVVGYALGSGRGIGGPSMTAPGGPQNGLVQRPSEVVNTGNLLITGNVAGGKYFHGGVPYRSTTRIDAPLGSTSLDAFMRYTEPVALDGYSPSYNTFYSPTGTVATLEPGREAAFVPGSGATGSVAGVLADVPIPTGSAAAQASATAGSDAGPLSFSLGARLRGGALPIGAEGGDESATDRVASPPPGSEEYREQLRQLQHRLGEIQAGADELERSFVDAPDERGSEPQGQPPSPPQADQGLSRRDALLQETARLLSTTLEISPDSVGSLVPQTPRAGQRLAAPGEPHPGVGLRLYDPQRDAQLTLNAALSVSKGRAGALAGAPQTQAADETAAAAKLPALQRIEETAAQANEHSSAYAGDVSSLIQRPAATSAERVTTLAENLRATADRERAPNRATETMNPVQPPPADEPAPAGKDSSLAFSPRDCETHLKAARSHLSQGKHLRAAESFALALAYNPNEPRAHFGRFQALFGVGEFLGSAVSLAQAIELDPQRAWQKTDLVWVSGGPETFIARFSELTEQARAAEAPQLQFLLAYLYYQMDQRDLAESAIDAAATELSHAPAVALLKAAIAP